MAISSFSQAFNDAMSGFAREVLEEELAWVKGGSPLFASAEENVAARERVASMDDAAVMELLEATTARPCPECGK